MPKLNVKQNNSNVIKAFQVALETGHRNLLDNPWWGSGEVINQRGITAAPSTNGSYTIDRWIYTTGATANAMSIGSNGITFTIASSSIWFAQRLANPAALAGKKLTASALLGNGTIISGTAVFTGTAQATFTSQAGLILYLTASGEFSIRLSATNTIRAVKLEVGSYSTIANDVPQNDELECMKYQLKIASGFNYTPIGFGSYVYNNSLRVFIPTPVPMKSASRKSQIAFTGGALLDGNGQNITVTGLTLEEVRSNGVYVNATTASGLTLYQTYSLVLTANASILLNCNL